MEKSDEIHVGEPAWEDWSEAVGNCDECAKLAGEDEYCSEHDPTDPEIAEKYRASPALSRPNTP